MFRENMEAIAAQSDIDLMLRVKDGDEGSFAHLLIKYRGPIMNYLYRTVQNSAVAEELAQDVFLRVYRARQQYVPTAKFTTWLYRIARHVALNSLRDGPRARTMEALDDCSSGRTWELRDPVPTIETTMVADVQEGEIRSAVATLPEKQRAAVILHKYHDMEYEEIARTLGCSESAVKSLLFRAYDTLRIRLRHLARR